MYDYKNSNQTHLITAVYFFFYTSRNHGKVLSKNSEITFEFELVEQNPTDIIQNFNKENYDFAMIHASIMS